MEVVSPNDGEGRVINEIGPKRRILFVAEAVTLAHIARPLALAASLDPAAYDLTLACDERCSWLVSECPFPILPIHSIPPESFSRALARGIPVYGESTLREYVREDLALISRVSPDVIVGDFRLSLSVSARVAKIPYVTITNAYWSPYGQPRYVVPSLPMTRFLPIAICNAVFNAIRPAAFALHTVPLNRMRKEYGLVSLGSDLRRTYTDADYVLYADVPELVPLQNLPKSHQYLGPIIWSPPTPIPEWWNTIPANLPLVYVSLGSSGDAGLLPSVVAAMANLPVRALVATAGATFDAALPPNVHMAAYLPGAQAARRASLVVCNGGSLTCQQALVAGVPVLGIAGNLDQFLNMNSIVGAGAGEILRADRFNADGLGRVVRKILDDQSYAGRAAAVQRSLARYPSRERFAEFFDGLGAVLA